MGPGSLFQEARTNLEHSKHQHSSAAVDHGAYQLLILWPFVHSSDVLYWTEDALSISMLSVHAGVYFLVSIK